MAEMLTFELVSPERKLASVEAVAVTIPGSMGEMTAMANHAPFLTTLRPGFVSITGGKADERFFVTGGFAEVSDNTVSVLAEEAFPASEVSENWLQTRISELESAIGDISEERVQAENQRLNDMRALSGQLN